MEDLEERVASLERQLAAMQETRATKVRLTIGQLCEAVGLSRYRLSALYYTYGLPIAEPKRKDGITPSYTMDDVFAVQQTLANLGISK